jgi:hypothetical protein
MRRLAAVLLIVPLIVGAAAVRTPAQDRPQAPDSRTRSPATAAAPSPASPKVLTGKERLGEKWMDEQRIDNCKVPVDKRGTKPRPDACSKPTD